MMPAAERRACAKDGHHFTASCLWGLSRADLASVTMKFSHMIFIPRAKCHQKDKIG